MTTKFRSRSAAMLAALTLAVTVLVAPTALAGATAEPGSYQEDSAAITRTGTWSKLANAGDSAGSSAYAQGPSSFEITFSGTSISWVGRKSPSSGLARVILDGQNVATVDRYADSNLFQIKLFEREDMAAGTHVLRVEWTGQKNANATGTSLHLDSVIVEAGPPVVADDSAFGPGSYEENNAGVVFSGKWAIASSSLDSGGTSTSLGSVGSAQFAFNGTSLQLFGRKSPSGGIARISIDGKPAGQFDRYSRSSDYQQLLFQSGTLSDSTHTVSVEWTGQKNAASGGTSIHLDSIKVASTPRVPVGAGVYEETSDTLAFTGPWSKSTSSADSGGSSSYSSYASSVSIQFAGTSIAWIGRTSASSGIASVQLDNRPAVDVDRYSASNNYQQTLFLASDLAAGDHTLTVSWTGRKSTAASSNALHFDAFRVSGEVAAAAAGPGVYGEDSSAISYEGAWSTSPSTGDQGGRSAYASGAARATLTFEGTGVAWIARRTANSGLANVTLDGLAQPVVDRYSATTSYQESVFLVQDLAPGRHTLSVAFTGRKNPQATGTAIHLDAFVVSNLGTALVQDAQLSSFGDSGPGAITASLSWAQSSGFTGEAISYSLRRVSDGVATDLATTSSTSFNDQGLREDTRYTYTVVATNEWGFSSRPSAEVVRETGSLDPRSDSEFCANPTTTVANGSQLRTALASAGPGTTIRLSPGVFRGTGRSATEFNGFTLAGLAGTSTQPIVICGSADSVVRLSDNSSGYSDAATAFVVSDSSWVRFEGVEIENVFAGFDVVRSSNIVIADASITNTGQAGIYLHNNSSDNTVIGSTITQTGGKDSRFGEGIYVGNSLDNDTCQPNCQQDKSDRNILAFNKISSTPSEPIEVKEQTSGGLIYRNDLGATINTSSITSSTLQVKGSDYLIYGNKIATSLDQGVRVLSATYSDGQIWGTKNVLAENTIAFEDTPSGEAVGIYGFASSLTVIKCSNLVTPNSIRLAPAACTP